MKTWVHTRHEEKQSLAKEESKKRFFLSRDVLEKLNAQAEIWSHFRVQFQWYQFFLLACQLQRCGVFIFTRSGAIALHVFTHCGALLFFALFCLFVCLFCIYLNSAVASLSTTRTSIKSFYISRVNRVNGVHRTPPCAVCLHSILFPSASVRESSHVYHE